MKFKFDAENNRLCRVEEEYSYELPDGQQFTTRVNTGKPGINGHVQQ